MVVTCCSCPRHTNCCRGCATKQQLKGLKEVTGNDATQAPGYDRLSEEAQEQVRLAFENDAVVDKDFKGIRTDLAKQAKKYGGEITNATRFDRQFYIQDAFADSYSYKVDVATRAAGCRSAICQDKGVKIVKGELRLGLGVPFDGEHESWQYKHWYAPAQVSFSISLTRRRKCMSKFDLEAAQERYAEETFVGIDALPDRYQIVVRETFEKGEVIEPPTLEMPKKSRAKKVKIEDDEEDGEPETPKPKGRGKKKKKNDDDGETETLKQTGSGTKRAFEADDSSEPEYVPKKSRSRAVPLEEVDDPAVAKIEAMTAAMRDEAAK
jgi:hypothetical protein